MGYALGNLFTTIEVFDPPSTPAMEVRVVPQFRGTPVSVSEIGFTPGKKATNVRLRYSGIPQGLLRPLSVW